MIGQIVTHYEIVSKLGGGGMGVVYKAQDLKLKRTVALKFLPPSLNADPAAKERFIHEAQAASALDHPNICVVHEVGVTEDDQLFIAMSYCDGATLKQNIERGRLKIDEATEIAIQIVQGLAKAHEAGIVHRDVKPANIMITRDGVVKIVDFGLARFGGATKITKTGTTLGTVAYMSPEQLEGSKVDGRADIFSFGVVLYEMLTGRTPFRGEHEPAMIYSIMNEEPEPLQKHIPDVSSELVHIVARALEKDPKNRYKTMDDVLIDLRRLRRESSRGSTPIIWRRGKGLSTSRLVAIGSSVVVLAAIISTLFVVNGPRTLPRLNPNPFPYPWQLPIKDLNMGVLSRDGNWIAFGGYDQNGKSDIYYMNAAGGAVRRVTNDSKEYGWADDCSRDGSMILATRTVNNRGEVAIVPPLGGPVRLLTAGSMGKFVPEGDRVIFCRGGWTGVPTESGKFELWSVKVDGSDSCLEFVDPGYSSQAGNIFVDHSASPDGRSIAWINTYVDFSQDIVTYDLRTKKISRVTSSRTPKGCVFWTKDNYLIYSSFASGNFDLWMCPAEGGEQLQITRGRNDEGMATLSDDGSKLLIYEQTSSNNIKWMDLATGEVSSVTSDDYNRQGLAVSPDNRYVAYTRIPGIPNWLTYRGIEIADTKGEDPVQTLCAGENTSSSRVWSEDGKWIAYAKPPDSAGGKIRICVVSPYSGTPSKVVAEAEGRPGENLDLRWANRGILRWYSQRKTWICDIDSGRTAQLYEDSTSAYVFKDKSYVLYRDYRAGREGWWIDTWPSPRAGKARKILGVIPLVIAPSGEFCLYAAKSGELHRVSLPDGKSRILPFSCPMNSLGRVITWDGKAIFYFEKVFNSKLTLWKDYFINE